jgi:tRNA modification GTPase
MYHNDTIAALSTAPGIGAIAVIRLSGDEAITICDNIFKGNKNLSEVATHTAHFGKIISGGMEIEEVVVTIFRGPNSYTKENVVEISCHGSQYVVQHILSATLAHGARLAKPGEFTMRAFLNGRFDLSQAEAVADLIASESEASHRFALQQMRGGFSNEIKKLRTELIHFASLLELELDFSEEDVEFANRNELTALLKKIQQVVKHLAESFRLGNVIKNGVATVIAGRPNAGKSTLLNVLLNEERAIVSAIPGTTRDTIEEILNIEGIQFRLIDTAGIREAGDEIERIGVEKTMQKIQQSAMVVYLFDVNELNADEVLKDIEAFRLKGIPLIIAANKIDDKDTAFLHKKFNKLENIVFVSAKESLHIEQLKEKLLEAVLSNEIKMPDNVVTNSRHFDALQRTGIALTDALNGIEQQYSKELIALDIRQALNVLGEITGEITNEDLLDNIFSKFCIGK